MARLPIIAAFAFVAPLGCKPAPPPLPVVPRPQSPTTAAQAFAIPKSESAIAGKVLFTGSPPQVPAINTMGRTRFPVRIRKQDLLVNANGTLQNVVVYVKSGFPEPFTPPGVSSEDLLAFKSPLMDANTYTLVPHVLAMQAGQTLKVRNADPDTHTWRINGTTCGLIQFAQPKQGMTHSLNNFTGPELGIRVGSNSFLWMSGYICVISHPYFNVTGLAGVFRLEGLPPGTYVIETWHETLGTKQQTVTVVADKLVRIKFTY